MMVWIRKQMSTLALIIIQWHNEYKAWHDNFLKKSEVERTLEAMCLVGELEFMEDKVGGLPRMWINLDQMYSF